MGVAVSPGFRRGFSVHGCPLQGTDVDFMVLRLSAARQIGFIIERFDEKVVLFPDEI